MQLDLLSNKLIEAEEQNNKARQDILRLQVRH
jgi:hypothetical protein